MTELFWNPWAFAAVIAAVWLIMIEGEFRADRRRLEAREATPDDSEEPDTRRTS